jgi:hypothetical protein
MTKRIRIQRRQILVGAGAVFAQAALSGGAARGQLAPQAALSGGAARGQLAPQAAAIRLRSKGVAPGYIISGRGQHASNPYFRPQGAPSKKQMPRPKAVHGRGVDEDTQ